MDKFVMSSRQAAELDHAFERNGWTPADVKKLSTGDILKRVLLVLKGKAEIIEKEFKKESQRVLISVMETRLPSVAAKKLSGCFMDKFRYIRDMGLDRWFNRNQPEQTESVFSVLTITRPVFFQKVVEDFFGISNWDIKGISQMLNSGHTTTLPAIESLIERQESGENTGLKKTGTANFFFVENLEGGVSVVHAICDKERWFVGVSQLNSLRVWQTGSVFFFRLH